MHKNLNITTSEAANVAHSPIAGLPSGSLVFLSLPLLFSVLSLKFPWFVIYHLQARTWLSISFMALWLL